MTIMTRSQDHHDQDKITTRSRQDHKIIMITTRSHDITRPQDHLHHHHQRTHGEEALGDVEGDLGGHQLAGVMIADDEVVFFGFVFGDIVLKKFISKKNKIWDDRR